MAMTGPAVSAALPGPVPDAPDDRALRAAFAAVDRRVRLQRALDSGAWTVCAGLVLGGLGLGLTRLRWVGDAGAWIAAGAALALTGFLWGALRRVPPLCVAQALDRALGTPDLLGSAWAF